MRRAKRRTRVRRWRTKSREDANCWAQMRLRFVARSNERLGDIGQSRDDHFTGGFISLDRDGLMKRRVVAFPIVWAWIQRRLALCRNDGTQKRIHSFRRAEHGSNIRFEDNGKRAFGHLLREPIGFGSPVIEPVLVPHRISCSSTLFRTRRFLHSLYAQRVSLFVR